MSLLRGLYAGGDEICVSDVVLAEVYSGLHDRDRAAAGALLSSAEYLETSASAAVLAGEWRYLHARAGRQLGVADCLIAATAHAHDATVVTGNVRDFPMPEVRVLELPK